MQAVAQGVPQLDQQTPLQFEGQKGNFQIKRSMKTKTNSKTSSKKKTSKLPFRSKVFSLKTE